MEKYQVFMTEKAEMDMESIYYYIATECMEPEAEMEQYDRIASQIRGDRVIVLRVLHCKQDMEGKLFE